MFIGTQLKKLRKGKGLTLEELQEKSGVQLATISRIENLKMTGTLESHMALAKALDVELKDLYTDIIKEDSRVELQEKGANRDVFVHNDRATYELLTSNVLQKKMMPSLLKLEPGGKTAVEIAKAGTEKFIYILNEALDVHIGKENYHLKSGDSMYFSASQEHYYENKSPKLAKAIVVATPVSL